MQAYMKSAMPYHGVNLPKVKAIAKGALKDATFDDVLPLWRGAGFREERYAALMLAGDRRFKEEARSLAALSIYDELITSGAWWDLVDDVATHRLGDLLRAHPAEMRQVLLDWSRHPDVWHRRSAIIAQVGFKRDTHWDLLQELIEPNRADTSFWIRKAIGWALREYSKVEPEAVRAYLSENETTLSGLSRRVGAARLPAARGRTSPAGRSRAPG